MRARNLAFVFGILALSITGVAARAQTAERFTLGVFLPTSIADGQVRFELAEALAKQLQGELRRPVQGKSFGRYEDFAAELKAGRLDAVIVDSWLAAVTAGELQPVGALELSGRREEPWVVAAADATTIPELKGQRVAFVRGAKGGGESFLENVVFEGDLDASREFTLVPVPNVESAVAALRTRAVAGAVLPSSRVPSDVRRLYSSREVPVAVMATVGNRTDPKLLAALKGLEREGPFDALHAIEQSLLGSLKRSIERGPPPRRPVLADVPRLGWNTAAVIDVEKLPTEIPSMVGLIELSDELPED